MKFSKAFTKQAAAVGLPAANGYTVYEGPSALDGQPIVVIALVKSSNRKTGNMVQTYVLTQATRPTAAVKSGADASICGDCKHRPFLGGSCYVVVAQGPTVVYKQWQAGAYPRATAAQVGALLAGRVIRLGTYGDPAAAPVGLWQALVAQAAGRTGYSHQWANEALPAADRAALAKLVMASVDSADEAAAARAAGLRYFRVMHASETLGAREFACPASEEAGKRTTCDKCRACDGSDRAGKASPAIVAHGGKASRFIPILSV
jgi:hypothetical protein